MTGTQGTECPPRNICFLGPDGSGKTTLARMYAGLLQARGCKTRLAWIRGTHTLASLLARILASFKLLRGPCNPYYNICIPARLQKPWIVIEFVSILPLLFLRFILPRLLGYTVVGERGLLDFIAWLTITLRDASVLDTLVSKFLASLSSRLCINIYVYARIEVLRQRRGNDQTLGAQLAVYNYIARKNGVLRVDTSSTTPAEALRHVLRVAQGA